MMIHEVNRRVRRHKRRKRLGRGNAGGHGTTCGRGTKGFKSRSGSGGYALYSGGSLPFYLKLPLRGFKNPRRREYATLNVARLQRHFKAGDEVTPRLLKERGIVKDLKCGLKILGEGELKFPLTVHAHRFSREARRKIEAVGGRVVGLPPGRLEK